MSIKVKINNDWVDTNIKAVRGVNHVNSEDVYTKQESDALFSDKISKTDIVQNTGTSTTSVMSQKAISDALSKKADLTNSKQTIRAGVTWTNNIYLGDEEYKISFNNNGDLTYNGDKVMVGSTVSNEVSLVQNTGQSTTSVMSQKAVSDAINKLKNAGYLYAGIATPSTNPGIPEGSVFYIANGKGTYTNFGGINVTEDEVVVLYYDTVWHKDATGIASNDKLTELESNVGEVYDGLTNIITISKNEYDVKHLIDVSNVTTEGYVDPDNGSINSVSGMYYTSIDVKEGDVVKIKNTTDSVVEYYYTRFIAAFDSNGDVIPSAGVSTATYEYVVPEGVVKLMPTFYKNWPKIEIEITRREEVIKSSVNNNTIPYEAFTEDAKDMLKSPFIKVQKDVNISTIDTISVNVMYNGYMAPDGNPSPDAQGYKYTSKIVVNTGDIISFQNGLVGGHQDVTPRFICAYDANENPIESRGSYGNIATMVITEDVHYIVVTTYVNENFTGLNILKSSVENKEDKHIKLLTNYGYQYNGSLSSGQICTFPLNTLKDKKSLAISVVLSSSFNGTLRIGRLHANSAFPYIDIDGTNVTVVNEFRTLSKPHGLSIANDLQVYLKIKNEYKIEKLVLVSGGISVDMADEDWRWFGNFGQPFVRPIGIEIPYISVGWSVSAFNQDIWICGDSYTSNASDRWVGYIYEHNLDNKIAVMGYSGSKSPEQYVSLCNMLKIHKPKFVVWCLGMNEEDTNAVNPQWKIYLDAVKNLCELYGINLILATIPCVPSIDNTYKNAIVRASGYRYIDFAKAVNAENAGATWYSGMLSSDNVHPSEKGAKALFYQAISDVPEMLSL